MHSTSTQRCLPAWLFHHPYTPQTRRSDLRALLQDVDPPTPTYIRPGHPNDGNEGNEGNEGDEGNEGNEGDQPIQDGIAMPPPSLDADVDRTYPPGKHFIRAGHKNDGNEGNEGNEGCLLYTSPSPRD